MRSKELHVHSLTFILQRGLLASVSSVAITRGVRNCLALRSRYGKCVTKIHISTMVTKTNSVAQEP
jgi:hypothetical protein